MSARHEAEPPDPAPGPPYVAPVSLVVVALLAWVYVRSCADLG